MDKVNLKYAQNSEIVTALTKKFDQKEFNFRNTPDLNSNYHAVYQRMLQGKATARDYASLHQQISYDTSQSQKQSHTVKLRR
jgi:hypothetical protein